MFLLVVSRRDAGWTMTAAAASRSRRPMTGPSSEPSATGENSSVPSSRRAVWHWMDGVPDSSAAATAAAAVPPWYVSTRSIGTEITLRLVQQSQRQTIGCATCVHDRAQHHGPARAPCFGRLNDETFERRQQTDDFLLASLTGPSDAVMRKAAQLRERCKLRGRAPRIWPQVQVEHLQQCRRHQVRPPTQYPRRLRSADCLAAAERYEARALRQEIAQIGRRGQLRRRVHQHRYVVPLRHRGDDGQRRQ